MTSPGEGVRHLDGGYVTWGLPHPPYVYVVYMSIGVCVYVYMSIGVCVYVYMRICV